MDLVLPFRLDQRLYRYEAVKNSWFVWVFRYLVDASHGSALSR